MEIVKIGKWYSTLQIAVIHLIHQMFYHQSFYCTVAQRGPLYNLGEDAKEG